MKHILDQRSKMPKFRYLEADRKDDLHKRLETSLSLSYNKLSSFFIFIIVLYLFVISLASAQGIGSPPGAGFASSGPGQIIPPTSYGSGHGFVTPQVYQPSFQDFYARQGIDYKTFFPTLDDASRCEARQDFILYIPVGGCSPGVVRSDLLEEQNVPVFCQVDALKLNPLIDVSWIRSVKFSGKYPQEVSGLSWHPSRAGLRFYSTLLQSPFLNNIGYVVVVLKRQPDEKKMPENVRLNVTAAISYDLEKAFGIGRVEYYVPVVSDDEWARNFNAYSFWRGKGYVRVDFVEENRAGVSIYQDRERKLASFVLEKGKTSSDIYLPGFYCKAAIQVRYDGGSAPERKVKIMVDDAEFFLREGERFLEDRCRIVSITPVSKGGKVVVNCAGKNLPLALSFANMVNLEKGGTMKNLVVGEGIGFGPEAVYALGVGEFTLSEKTERRFVVLGKGIDKSLIGDDGKIKKDLLERIGSALAGTSEDQSQTLVSKVQGILKAGSSAPEVVVVAPEGNAFEYKVSLAGSVDKVYTGDQLILEEYFEAALKSAQELASLYNEKTNSGETYGEKALLEAADLAGKIGKQKKQIEILEKVAKDYFDSSSGRYAEGRLHALKKYNLEQAVNFVDIANQLHTVQLLDIKEPGFDELSARFLVSTNEKTLGLNEVYTYDFQGVSHTLLVKVIERERVTLSHSSRDKEGRLTNQDVVLKVNERRPDIAVELREIKFEAEGKVMILPRLPYQFSEANLTVQVGIEKRAIKLSDEKTLEMIENLNQSIGKFEKIVSNLGKTVKVMKGACFATIGVLLAKNFVVGLGGGVQARQAVMQKWNARCQADSHGDRVLFNDCLRKNNDEIQADVASYKGNVEAVNTNLKKIQDQNKNDLGGVDIPKATTAYRQYMKDTYGGGKRSISVLERDAYGAPTGKSRDVPLTNEMLDTASLTEMRDLELAMKNGDSQQSTVNSLGLGQSDKSVLELEKRNDIQKNYQNHESVLGKNIRVDADAPLRETIARPYYGQTLKDFKDAGYKNLPTLPDSTPVQALAVGSNYYVAPLNKGQGERYGANEWYSVSKNNDQVLTKVTDEKELKRLNDLYFLRQDSTTLTNPWGTAAVSFHETGSFKGLPAIVPLGEKWGKQRGWYAATTSYGVFEANAPKAFTEAAIPKNYYICNIGQNKIQEFETSVGDDACQFINVDAVSRENFRILGLSSQESRELYQASQQALYQAGSQYSAQGRAGGRINVLDGAFNVGAPPILGGARCQDFMSPADCQLMFNVCDPVLCPASRCNLGGAYPVADVVQSGIIGSTVLCLPNFREGVLIPVCLSGIQAGLDGYVQILKLVRGCLQESLATGRNIGICDELKSIYMCEFFWRQISPLSKLLVAKLIETATGQGTRGGGEYLTVKDSFAQLDKSVDYLKNDYALNAYQAFQKRSSEDVGTEICKGFVSARYPSNKKFLDNLLEPDSPHQFYASFDEIPFTEATVPATSQYKVYYAIYAGKDEATYYSVYLKSPPESGYYLQQQFITVSVGFVPRGKSVDETRDFTAPAGYKELCVRINGKDECGFKQVSSSFAVNYLRDQYVKDQASQTNIRSEEECVSGTPIQQGGSPLGLLQPNLQEGVQRAVSPSIYKEGYLRGVTRICSTQNPGKSIDPKVGSQEARWKEVGTCRAGATPLKCWLDTESVQDAIRNKGLAQEAVQDVKIGQLRDNIESAGLTDQESAQALAGLRDDVAGLNPDKLSKALRISDSAFGGSDIGGLVKKADVIEQRGFLNSQKAEALLSKYKIFDMVARFLGQKFKPVAAPATGGGTTDGGTTDGGTTGTGVTSDYTYLIGLYQNKGFVQAGFVDKIDARWNVKAGKAEINLVVSSTTPNLQSGFVQSYNDLNSNIKNKIQVKDISLFQNILNAKDKNDYLLQVLGAMKSGRYSLDGNGEGQSFSVADLEKNAGGSGGSGTATTSSTTADAGDRDTVKNGQYSKTIAIVFDNGYFDENIADKVSVRWSYLEPQSEVSIQLNNRVEMSDFVSNLDKIDKTNFDLNRDLMAGAIEDVKYVLGARTRKEFASRIEEAVKRGRIENIRDADDVGYVHERLPISSLTKEKISVFLFSEDLFGTTSPTSTSTASTRTATSGTSGVPSGKKYSHIVELVFHNGIDDRIWLRWNFEMTRLEFQISTNGKTRTDFLTRIEDVPVDQDIASDMYQEDITIIKDILKSGNPKDFASSIQRALRTTRASIGDDGKYDLSIQEVNRQLYGRDEAPGESTAVSSTPGDAGSGTIGVITSRIIFQSDGKEISDAKPGDIVLARMDHACDVDYTVRYLDAHGALSTLKDGILKKGEDSIFLGAVHMGVYLVQARCTGDEKYSMYSRLNVAGIQTMEFLVNGVSKTGGRAGDTLRLKIVHTCVEIRISLTGDNGYDQVLTPPLSQDQSEKILPSLQAANYEAVARCIIDGKEIGVERKKFAVLATGGI